MIRKLPKDNVYVVRHYAPSKRPITNPVEVFQRVNYLVSYGWLAEKARSSPCI